MSGQEKVLREVLIEKICEQMGSNDKIFFLSDDFGGIALDKLRQGFTNRFVNVGIAEQNLINISLGLALEDFTVYAYGIAAFLTMRAYEQIRLNLSLLSEIKKVNINLIGVGTGLSYDMSGPTHHCLEDVSIMRVLPNLVIFSPSDWVLLERFVGFSVNVKKPKYIRLDGAPLAQIYGKNDKINLEDGFYELIKGEKICLISTGIMTHKALKVSKEYFKGAVGVIDIFMLNPINNNLLFKAFKKYKYVITVEEGFINKGGVDTVISNILIDKQSNIKLNRMGIDDKYVFDIGEREYLHKINRLDEKSIVRVIKEIIKRNQHSNA